MIKSFIGKLLTVGMLVIPGITVFAQVPNPYTSGTPVNFIRTYEALAPDSDYMALETKALKDVRMTTQYFDGIGRPFQTVVKKGSLVTGSVARDMVSPVLYDMFGREQYKFLPFAADTTGGYATNDGLFKLNPYQQQSAFMTAQYSSQSESDYYNKTNFETSPLSRVEKTMAPGANWAGSSRGVESKYWLNTSLDSGVRVWTFTPGAAETFGTYATSTTYAAGELYKNITADEHGKQVIEFTDKLGKLILKKVQLTAVADTGTGKGYTGWLCTYYIYDDLGNLRCVVQPKGVELLAANSWSMSYSSGVILNEQCFRYEYDRKNRMTMKKVPGAGTVYMIYDGRDRLVMTQDSVMRANQKWAYTLYDNLNRDTTTGLITDASHYNDPGYHRSHADTSVAWPNLGSYTDEPLTKTFYDNYNWRGWEGNPLSATRSTSYDSYLLTASNTSFPYPQDATMQTGQLKGIATGTKTKVLGTSTYLYSVPFYDDKSRMIQTQSTNITGGTDISITQYSWAGQALLSIDKNEKAGTNAQTITLLTQSTYDSLWRVIKTEKKIASTKVSSGSMPGSWETISQNEYDALGQLKTKALGVTPLETQTFEYNVRGWMLGMNRDFVMDTTKADKWFGFDLGYDKTGFSINGNSLSYAAAQYNGNISGMIWRGEGDRFARKYDFTYDAPNRFASADFNQFHSSSFSKADGIDFSVSGMTYDANGNIGNMNQKGWKLGGSVTIDSLLYGYTSNSNKLTYVTDRKNDSTSLLGDFKEYTNNTSQDYTYDPNGNLTKDANKKIDTILYNHLNLPDSIHVTGKGGIKYVYDAADNKLKKITTEGSTITTTLYLTGNYVNDTLQYIPTEEGRARINDASSAVVYDYMLKDHLGNVRMVLTEETKTDSYPAATMEDANTTVEESYYGNLPYTRMNPPRGYPANTPPGNAKVAIVRGNLSFGPTHWEIGPNILLKVMAGDKFDLTVNSWWSSFAFPNSSSNPQGLYQLLNAIGFSTLAQSGHFTSGEVQGSSELNNSLTSFLSGQAGSYNTSLPKAFVNWILFDERFNYVGSSSGYEQVGSSGTYTTHSFSDLSVDKSGYLFVYVSNETPNIDVYFDNLQVNHVRGPLVEEEHFYPFGLTQAGISSQALGFGGGESKKKFQGQEFAHKEFSDGSGLEMYEFKYRMDDPQTGRFWQIDPLAEKYFYNSTYAFSEDKVTSDIELEGLESIKATGPIMGYNLISRFFGKEQTPEQKAQDKAATEKAMKKFNAWASDPNNQIMLMACPLMMSYETVESPNTTSTISEDVEASSSASEGVDLTVKAKPGWTANQMAQAEEKTATLTNAETVYTKDPVARDPNLRKNFIKNGGQISSTEHLDHLVDLQLGGTNAANNLKPLDVSVNTSIGKQLQLQMRNLPDKTRINRVILIKPYPPK